MFLRLPGNASVFPRMRWRKWVVVKLVLSGYYDQSKPLGWLHHAVGYIACETIPLKILQKNVSCINSTNTKKEVRSSKHWLVQSKAATPLTPGKCRDKMLGFVTRVYGPDQKIKAVIDSKASRRFSHHIKFCCHQSSSSFNLKTNRINEWE